MGVPGKTRGHSIDIVLGGSRKNRGVNPNSSMANFTEALVKEAKDPETEMNDGFKKAVLDSQTAANRAGTPTRMMNMNMMNQNDMNMPFQNNAIFNAQGMKGVPDQGLQNPNIPGTLPGSGNIPGNQQVLNPVGRMENPIARTEGEKPFVPTGTVLPELNVDYNRGGSGYAYNTATGEERKATAEELEQQKIDNQSTGSGRVTASYVNKDGEKVDLGNTLYASF